MLCEQLDEKEKTYIEGQIDASLKEITEMKEKIKQYSVVVEMLIRGHTFDEALEHLINWQKGRRCKETRKWRKN